MKINIPKLSKIKLSFAKLPQTLARRAFLSSLLFVFVSLILGGVLFYKYYVLIQRESSVAGGIIRLNEDVYQDVLTTKQIHQREFEAIDSKEYFNPFEKSSFQGIIGGIPGEGFEQPTSTEELTE